MLSFKEGRNGNSSEDEKGGDFPPSNGERDVKIPETKQDGASKPPSTKEQDVAPPNIEGASKKMKEPPGVKSEVATDVSPKIKAASSSEKPKIAKVGVESEKGNKTSVEQLITNENMEELGLPTNEGGENE